MDWSIQNDLGPLLSEADPAISSEGALDPLGLYAIADALGVRLAPGVRERQQHPRYLTAIAVAAEIGSHFPEDAVAADNVSEPWQVFEWYMVEGLVRGMDADGDIPGLPGKDKVRRCIQDKVPVAARTYLKTPSVFGFHGVYRLLARTLRVIDDSGCLSGTGDELLSAWVREQGLDGFRISDSQGTGAAWRRKLVQAVETGISKGGTDSRWGGWDFFTRYLHPFRFGKAESEVILQALMDEEPLRGELIQFLVSDAGQAVMHGHEAGFDQAVHRELRKHCSAQMQQILYAIMAYERFARLLQDAFDDCLEYLTRSARKTPPAELAELAGVTVACNSVHDLFHTVEALLAPFNESIRFTQQFSLFSEKLTPVDWLNRLIEHHCKIQAAKPPDGKAPWLQRFDDGDFMIQTANHRDDGGRHDESYVHAYRAQALWSFLKDLGRVNS